LKFRGYFILVRVRKMSSRFPPSIYLQLIASNIVREVVLSSYYEKDSIEIGTDKRVLDKKLWKRGR
jgi:hypothetical protein